jgi:hypothetical protein
VCGGDWATIVGGLNCEKLWGLVNRVVALSH